MTQLIPLSYLILYLSLTISSSMIEKMKSQSEHMRVGLEDLKRDIQGGIPEMEALRDSDTINSIKTKRRVAAWSRGKALQGGLRTLKLESDISSNGIKKISNKDLDVAVSI